MKEPRSVIFGLSLTSAPFCHSTQSRLRLCVPSNEYLFATLYAASHKTSPWRYEVTRGMRSCGTSNHLSSTRVQPRKGQSGLCITKDSSDQYLKTNPDARLKARPEKIIPGVGPPATYCNASATDSLETTLSSKAPSAMQKTIVP